MGKIIHPEVNCREKKKYLEGKRHSEIMFCKGNAVLSRKNYSYGRNTLDGK